MSAAQRSMTKDRTIEQVMQDFRRRVGRDPEALRIIAKADAERIHGLHKAEVSRGYERTLTRAEAVAEVYERNPGLYDAEVTARAQESPPAPVAKADRSDRERRDMFVDVERLADELQVSNRSLTRAQAVSRALALQPRVYDRAVLMQSGGSL